MTRRYIQYFLFAGLITMILAGCNKKENLNIDLPYNPDTWVKGPIDNWILSNYTKPFNIEIKYRWEPYEVKINKFLVPVYEANVIPVMDIVKKVWVDPYTQEAGIDFIKKYSPKQFILLGSAEYNNDGTIVLGEAEGGRKITLTMLNDFDRKNVPAVKQMLHTIHHEFAHILHQTILYQREYKQVTPSGYTASWYNTSDAEALSIGFITPYARASSDEDFVEMIATMLVEGKVGFDAIVNSAPAQARTFLRQKEAFVVAYFQNSWNIDIYSLQTKTEAAIKEATK